MVSNTKAIFTQDRIFTLIDQGVNSGGNLLITVIVARLLSLNDFGVYSVGLLLGMLAMEVCQALVSAPAQTIGPKLPDGDLDGYCCTTTWLAGLLTLFTGMTIFWGCMAYILFSGLSLRLVQIFFFVFVSAGMQLHLFARRVAYIRNNIFSTMIGSSFRYAFHLVAIIFIGFTSLKTSLEAHLMILGLTSLSSALLTTFLWWPKQNKTQFPLYSALQKHWEFGKWLFGSAAINWFGSNWFMAVAGTTLGASALGILRAAQNISGVIGIIAQIMENAIPVKAAEIKAKLGSRACYQYILRIGVITVCAGFGLTLLLGIFSSQIMALVYSENYRDYGSVLTLVGVTYILSLVVFLIKVIFRSFEILRPVFITQTLIAVLTLSSAGIIISRFGVTGAASGLMLVQLMNLVILSIFANSLMKIIK